ncbi:DUF3267 domain-containing protein [Halomarina pelagica]|uniref:DUF3267 domain-containing protein n=1 Tax=Halomarina pelagica TaxID=2961599 RepID=UPI0020C41A7E|nr:DUF3267 domain-containing protein [Halomarina sp. BND7]
MGSRPESIGYGAPYEFSYPRRRLQAAGLAATVVAIVLGTVVAALPRGGEIEFAVETASFVGLLGSFVATIVVHEGVHAIAARALGYRVAFGVDRRLPGVYAAAFGQIVTRRDQVLIALAPLVVVDALAVALLALGDGPLVGVGFVAFVVNTAGAVGDLYVTWRAAGLPRGSVFYDVSATEMYVFEPEGAS